MVLLGVKDLKQCRGWIAAKIHTHLVDFIQQEHRILRSCFLHHLDNLSRESSDVSAAMTPDFSFIADTTQRQPDKFAACCFRNRGGKGRFPNSRGTDEAEDRTL